MLSELADYARDHGLSAQPGYKLKNNLKAYIVLSADGTFLGVEIRVKDARPVYAPDIGSAANGTRFCNPLVEKAKIPLRMVEDESKDKNIPTKFEFFLSMLDNGEKYEPSFHAITRALRSEDTRAEIVDSLKKNKIKGADVIGFKVDGIPAEEGKGCSIWWNEFRKRFSVAQEGVLPRCLITGDLAPAMATVPKVSGLRSVGGHTSGDAFLCFDKDAFQSYDLKQSANAPVSEEGMTAVNAALTDLISKAPVFGGAKLVHWYAGNIPDDFDLIDDMMDGDWGDDGEAEEDVQEETDHTGEERAALKNAKQMLESVDEGERPFELSARYYIMPLSGAGGRMMVRGWYEGSFGDLYKNIDLWFEDLRLINVNGKSFAKSPKLKALCVRLLKPGGDPKKVFERMDSELSNLSLRLLDAIIKGNPLPDEVATRVLRYIRSAVLSSPSEEDEKKKTFSFQDETMAFQLLKAWLVRHQRQRGEKNIMGCDVNQSPRTVAYCCGQLMAVYSVIQAKAMPDVNVGINERYYAAASSTPAFVIGKLAQLSQHHLSKLDDGLSIYYEKMLGDIYTQIGQEHIPTSLNQEQQTEFALGYYQQRAAIFSPTDK
ncbi:MAG: type I-C CRISPR-associated protein Cas8c/Csd1 [Lachnospiraceae bacterium]|nr:type I-C CRISPR-associated protein Cas8c/Csd1 [Lachnospiraceae bacterium]